MIRKIIIALVSSVIICLSFALVNYTPETERESNVQYFSFSSLVMIYLVYATPVYLLLGVPFSILIERIKRKIKISHSLFMYFFEVSVYLIAGLLATFIFLLVLSEGRIFSNPRDAGGFFLLGGIASFLYYHLYMLSYLVKRKEE
ncbi:hypothetical protein [Brevibacillus sp. 179-C 1.1 NHS]|uniref:hypothetical protein n=1 Tax=Brevibacillus sp. 179-C 1.1 NHS TaxID=3235177 RepID=UPI0039A2CDF3